MGLAALARAEQTHRAATLGLLVTGGFAYGQTGKKIVIGFSQVGAETEWRVAMSRIMKETFAKQKDMTLLFSDAQQKQENQLKALRTFILQKVDFLVFAPVVQTGWDAVLQEAKEAKKAEKEAERLERERDPDEAHDVRANGDLDEEIKF